MRSKGSWGSKRNREVKREKEGRELEEREREASKRKGKGEKQGKLGKQEK